MPNSLESSSQTSDAGKKKRTAIFLTGLAILLGFIPVTILKAPIKNNEPPLLVMRVDDIQDYTFREAQIFLLNESIINRVPLSLAIIPGVFGEDREIVEMVKLAVSLGSEVTAHGWIHEDLATFSVEEQAALLLQARTRIEDILGYDTRVLVPPMFSFNNDTISAMQEAGYNIISSHVDISEPGLLSKVISLPGTVDLSDYSHNGTWNMKSVDSVKAEISSNVQKYGFAVIVTHPQEFLNDGELNQVNTELYRALLNTLKEEYLFETLERLGENWR